MTPSACWFCGDQATPGHQARTGVHRDPEDQFLGLRREWKATWVDVPRCRRCRIGHEIDKVVKYVLIASAAVTGLMLLAWTASRLGGEAWADEWQLVLPVLWTILWLVLWRAIRTSRIPWNRLAPKPEKHAREHPAIQQLVEDGWENREGGY
ncbi:hypothetical protein FB561_2253 [Kribbella amoyensis]|uniref:Uncharacterized protein n=1 Tax=Kribbella amoyensis TaxID=996641 RepID=A0A561BQI8_9ACTN|nr:hypothetical protein [Kribbella amoyensis]TWD81149.1 hypothetical protein FB561_2253 [Kribbella amoyensis]